MRIKGSGLLLVYCSSHLSSTAGSVLLSCGKQCVCCSGQIDAKELQKALGMGNLHFSLQVVASMIRCVSTFGVQHIYLLSLAEELQ